MTKDKLKTLNDEREYWLTQAKGNPLLIEIINRIFDRNKAEAIKWVKEIRNVWGEGLAVEKSDKILIDFFNITEEDLK